MQASIKKLLEEQFPGRFTCAPGTQGYAKGLNIRCVDRDGYAFVYEPTQNGQGHLLALHESDGDQDAEVWGVNDAEEVVRRIQPWAFPKQWTPPAPVNPTRERKRLRKIAKGLALRVDVECRFPELRSDFLDLLTKQTKDELEKRDLDSIAPERIVRNFPCDAAGRLALKTVVLLKKYQTDEPPGRDRDLCLAAIGPEYAMAGPSLLAIPEALTPKVVPLLQQHDVNCESVQLADSDDPEHFLALLRCTRDGGIVRISIQRSSHINPDGPVIVYDAVHEGRAVNPNSAVLMHAISDILKENGAWIPEKLDRR